MNEAISDNRYELIKKYKQKLIEATNIESREDEMKVIDNILFRFWHIGWLDRLEGVCFDEWCDDCKEYDTEKKCCPRFNRVIRGALKREPSEDGTLEVKVEDATKVGRVLISDDKHRGGLYYPDEDEPQGDLISRAEAIEALGEEPPVWCDEEYEIAERDQWRADIEAIKSVPSADRPTDGDLISREAAISIPILPKEHRKVFRNEDDAFETGWNEALACVNMLPSADRPRGEWTSLAEERPVDNYEIMATVYWPGYGDSTIAVGHIDRFDNWHLYSPTEGELIKGFEVIAWMPLPELYKESDTK